METQSHVFVEKQRRTESAEAVKRRASCSLMKQQETLASAPSRPRLRSGRSCPDRHAFRTQQRKRGHNDAFQQRPFGADARKNSNPNEHPEKVLRKGFRRQ